MTDHFLTAVREGLRIEKEQADKSIAQVSDADLHRLIDPEANSIAVIVRHMVGNMRSRWTDFLTTDGEKPSRDRDGEFETQALTRAELLAEWEAGWAVTLAAIDALTPDDLGRTVTIRDKPLTVATAIDRQVRHYSEHVGQIILLAKHFAGANWQTVSVPKKKRA
jgi:hypothetical protein